MKQRGERSSCSQVTARVIREGPAAPQQRDRVRLLVREKRESLSGVGGARCPVGESEQDGSETDHTLHLRDPALWPTRMTDADKVNLVRVMAKRAPFSERAKELPSDAEGREFPNYLTYSTSHNGREKNRQGLDSI